MDEEELKKIVTPRTYTLTFGHTVMVTKISEILRGRENRNVSDSEIVRMAIEGLLEKVETEERDQL